MKIKIPSGKTCRAKIDGVLFEVSVAWTEAPPKKRRHYIVATSGYQWIPISRYFRSNTETRKAYESGFRIPARVPSIAMKIARFLVKSRQAQLAD